MTQVLDAGGQGLFFYAYDLGSQAPRYVRHKDPERWEAIIEYADLVSDHQRRVEENGLQASTDTAVLVSVDDWMAGTHKGHSLYTAYVMLHEFLKIDFDFISDRQLIANDDALAGYQTIYVPEACLIGSADIERLEAFVASGNRLIITDTDSSFGFDELQRARDGAASRRSLKKQSYDDFKTPFEIVDYAGGQIFLFRKSPFKLQTYRSRYWIETIRQIQQMF